jgi:hypothetical protein
MTSDRVELHWYVCKECHLVFLFERDLEEHIKNHDHEQ